MGLGWLLDKLCVDQRFCLPSHERERLLALDFADADALTREILRAEGFDPEYDREHYVGVFATVQPYYFPSAEPDSAESQRRLMKRPPRAGDAIVEPKFERQVAPAEAMTQDEQDAAEGSAIGDTEGTAVACGGSGGSRQLLASQRSSWMKSCEATRGDTPPTPRH